MDTRDSNPARLAAPIALVVFGIAALIIVASAGGGGHKEESGPTKAERRDLHVKKRAAARAARRAPLRVSRAGVYVVRTGDTLGGIAEKTGLTVERLQELNPSLDPQALVSGQRIKLR